MTVATTAIVSVIVGLVLSAVARYKQLLLPIVVLVVLLSLVFSAACSAGARDGFEQVSWLFPSGGGSRPGFHHRPAIDRSAGRARRALGPLGRAVAVRHGDAVRLRGGRHGLLWWWLRRRAAATGRGAGR
ncbi:hypothetical protein I552_0409 [Mycobacterium xenopi 3993]|nr:hypothetical protein I552_0409 [Mycobacterium xenopi 3993]